MQRVVIASVALLLLCPSAKSEETGEEAVAEAAPPEAPASPEASTDEQKTAEEGGPKTMSGMSILGNEEAPKSLVIIPWKSSELGEDISLSNTLDDRAQPVDKDVFLRELSFYEIRSGK